MSDQVPLDQRPDVEPLADSVGNALLPISGESGLVKVDAQNIFGRALKLLGEVGVDGIVKDSDDLEGMLKLGYDYEAAGMEDEAAYAFEKAMKTVSEGQVNHRSPVLTLFKASNILKDMSRVQGNVRQGFGQYVDLIDRCVEPTAVVETARLNNPAHGGYEWPELPGLTTLKGLISDLPENTTANNASRRRDTKLAPKSKEHDAVLHIQDVCHGITDLSSGLVKGMVHGIRLAHELGEADIVEALLAKAKLLAQMKYMPLQQILDGKLEAVTPPQYDADAAFHIADVLRKIGRTEEAVGLALDYPKNVSATANSMTLLADAIPELLRRDSSDPEALDYARRFIEIAEKNSDQRKKYEWAPVVDRGVMRIALILHQSLDLETVAKGLPNVKEIGPGDQPPSS